MNKTNIQRSVNFVISEELADSEAIPRHLRNGILCPDRSEEPDLGG